MPAARAPFYRAEALDVPGTLDMLLRSYYEDIDLAFRLRWAGYRCVYTPACCDPPRHLGDQRPQEPGAPASDRPQRRARLLVEPARSARCWRRPSPTSAFIAMQAAWRLARGRLGPFLAGKLDAVCVWREVLARRRVAPRSPTPPSAAPISPFPADPRPTSAIT